MILSFERDYVPIAALVLTGLNQNQFFWIMSYSPPPVALKDTSFANISLPAPPLRDLLRLPAI
jgi:hypothetical protein